jgi:hypothetical protein
VGAAQLFSKAFDNVKLPQLVGGNKYINKGFKKQVFLPAFKIRAGIYACFMYCLTRKF